LDEYGELKNAIAISPSSAPACFSGATTDTLTVLCETDLPQRAIVLPASATIAASDAAASAASFSIIAIADATNDAPHASFNVICSVLETPGKGTISFHGIVENVRQPSIRGFCLDFSEDYCVRTGEGAIKPSLVTSGNNNVTLYAAMTLSGMSFDNTTAIVINGTACVIIEVAADGRSMVFTTPSIVEVGEGFRMIVITNKGSATAAAGELCWGAECGGVDRCTAASGSLCPALPLMQRGIYFTGVCVGFNRRGLVYPPSTNPKCTSRADNEASDHCSLGRGATCRNCPVGCRCPGGPRCWVLRGYWASSVDSSVAPMACKPDAEAKLRCLGFDETTGVAACGMDHDGYMCEGCRKGYYRSLAECFECPSTEVIQAIAVPLISNAGIAMVVFTTLILATFGVMRLKLRVFRDDDDAIEQTWQETLREGAS